MPDAGRDPWFAAKRYGYGSGRPTGWQGWLSLSLLLVVTLAPWYALVIPLAKTRHAMAAVAAAVLVDGIATLVFARVCGPRTTGGWRWRWGGRNR